jgi:hypothetical protein
MFTTFNDACIQSFPHVCCNSMKSFCSDQKQFIGRDTVDLFDTGGSENVSISSFDDEALRKRHLCSSTVWWQLKGWSQQDGLLHSHSDTVFINPAELYWILTINKYFNINYQNFLSLYKACENGWFSLQLLRWTLTIAWYIFDTGYKSFRVFFYSRLQVEGCHTLTGLHCFLFLIWMGTVQIAPGTFRLLG